MSTEIAVRNGVGSAVAGFTQDQVDLIKRTIAKDATNDELALFVHQAERSGLDPFSHQIWFTKRAGKMSILTGIDGYRLIGERTGRRAGSDTYWCGDDGQWVDVWLSKAKPAAAKTVVKVVTPSGAIAEYSGIALWSEYGEKADGFMWPKMPAAQLGKCSEALAYRRAFPAEVTGLYVKEEMDQAALPEQVPAQRSGTVMANGRPVDVATGEVKTSRPVRRPPTAPKAEGPAAAAPGPVGEDVWVPLVDRVQALNPDAREFFDTQTANRGIPGIGSGEFTAQHVLLVEGLLKTAEKIADPF